jgi:hypothetical protein
LDGEGNIWYLDLFKLSGTVGGGSGYNMGASLYTYTSWPPDETGQWFQAVENLGMDVICDPDTGYLAGTLNFTCVQCRDPDPYQCECEDCTVEVELGG